MTKIVVALIIIVVLVSFVSMFEGSAPTNLIVTGENESYVRVTTDQGQFFLDKSTKEWYDEGTRRYALHQYHLNGLYKTQKMEKSFEG